MWRTLYGEEPLTLPNYRADLRDGRHADELWTAAERLLCATYGKPEAGQVVLFRLRRTTLPKHCGILVAPDRFIHAQEGLGVIEANLTDGWRKRVFGLFEFPEATRS